MKNTVKTKALTIAGVLVLALAVAPTAKAEGRKCSNATLKGTFADKDTGFVITPSGSAVPIAGANIETFDGNGNMSGSGMTSVNGDIFPGTFKGTYTVNPDCTGTYTSVTPQGFTVNAFFVIADGGNELHIVITNPGTAITCIARRQFPVGDGEKQ